MKPLLLLPFTVGALSLPALISAADSKCATGASVSGGQNIVETAVAAGKFKTLAAALTSAGLVETLSGEGPFTVFAPTDEAFAKLPADAIANLLKPENRGKLTGILTYHVVPGRVPAAKVVELASTAAINGQRIPIRVEEGTVSVAGATVVQSDIACKNGIIHVVDTVMMPSVDDLVATAGKAGSFKTLTAALGAAGLVEVLQGKGPFTVFAPTDEAFSKLPEGTVATLLQPENRAKLVSILKYHVVAGRVYSDQLAPGDVATLQGGKVRVTVERKTPMLNRSRFVETDIETTNGVIHVIDTVLLPE